MSLTAMPLVVFFNRSADQPAVRETGWSLVACGGGLSDCGAPHTASQYMHSADESFYAMVYVVVSVVGIFGGKCSLTDCAVAALH